MTAVGWMQLGEDPTCTALGAFGVHLALALAVTVHVLLAEKRSQSTAGWIAVAWFSPFLGAALYTGFGVNRVHRKAARLFAGLAERAVPVDGPEATVPESLHQLRRGLDGITGTPLVGGNLVEPLVDGDQAYPAMLAAIATAQTSIAFQTFILDRDAWGVRFVDALEEARKRGVDVRVQLDGIGTWFSWPTIIPVLRRTGLVWDRFLWNLDPRRMAFVNLRNHRKVLVVDGRVAFTGGMNVRARHVIAEHADGSGHRDLHFRVEGPVVKALMGQFAADWMWEVEEPLSGDRWFPALAAVGDVAARVIPDGPDEGQGRVTEVFLQALACARRRVCILTPYFLPEEPLVWALGAAVRRGVEVHVVLPSQSNQLLAQWAMGAALPAVLDRGVHVWLQPAPFDHTKLLVVDDAWCAFGSSNWDPRSLRLNFELLVEAWSPELACRMVALFEARRARSVAVDAATLRARPLPVRVRDGLANLLTPYL